MGLIRFLLALAVLFSHVGAPFGISLINPGASVYAFFVLSGFYISMGLNTRYVGTGSVKRFYVNRMLRLWPCYLIALISTVPTGVFAVFRDSISYLEWWQALLVVLANVSMLGVDVFNHFSLIDGKLVFAEAAVAKGYNGSRFMVVYPSWSISVELLFYAVAPFVVRSFKRSVAFALFGLFYCVAIKYFPQPGFRVDLYYPHHIAFFGIGIMTYWAYQLKGNWDGKTYAMAALYCLLVMSAKLDVSAVIYLAVAVAALALFEKTQSNAVDKFLGDLSYPIYILHFQVSQFVRWIDNNVSDPLIYVGVTLVVSVLAVLLVERPMERLRSSWGRARREQAAVA